MKEPAQDNSDIIEELEARIHALIEENRLLKERMDEAGVSYADIVHNESRYSASNPSLHSSSVTLLYGISENFKITSCNDGFDPNAACIVADFALWHNVRGNGVLEHGGIGQVEKSQTKYSKNPK